MKETLVRAIQERRRKKIDRKGKQRGLQLRTAAAFLEVQHFPRHENNRRSHGPKLRGARRQN